MGYLKCSFMTVKEIDIPHEMCTGNIVYRIYCNVLSVYITHVFVCFHSNVYIYMFDIR